MKKILIVEDSSVIIIGVLHILKEIGFDQSLVDTANSFDTMLAMIAVHDYALIFFGFKMDNNKQLRPLLEVVKKYITSLFILFTDVMEVPLQKKIYRAGVRGILDKMSTKKEISFAIKRVLENEIYMDTASAIKLLFSDGHNKKVHPVLTEREWQVAELLIQGKKNIHISSTLNIKPSTVCTFKTKIFNKLNIKNIIELKEWGMGNANYTP